MKFFSTIFLFLFLLGCKQVTNKNLERASYTSQKELDKPIVFAPGEITTRNGINFSLDGSMLYTSQQLNKKFDNGSLYLGVF